MPGVFSDYSNLLPPALKGVKTMASSAVRPAAPRRICSSTLASGRQLFCQPWAWELLFRHAAQGLSLHAVQGSTRMVVT